MFSDRRPGARTRALLLAASLVFITWQLPALAQSADPSERIATITDAAGNLSFAPAGSDDWAQAGLNRPITTGDRLWVDNGGQAELHAGSTAIRLGSGTAVTVLNLDDSATQVKLTQGTLQLRVRALPPDQPVEIDTPNVAFVPAEPGDYRLDVAPDGSNTVVTMHHGSAVVYGDNRSRQMRRGEQIRFAGTDLAEAGSATNPPLDGFDRWTMARDAREDSSPSARYVAPEMTGYAALDDYGDWQEDPGYGAVWFPRVVAAGWAPYSTGYWAWVAPWGWSWCDDAPWGFAPSHYGRWARIGNRWGWMPGPRSVRPVYAPAVVGFIGEGHGHGRGPGVAWYPLGPHEAYRPVYGASPAYLSRINRFAGNNEAFNRHGGNAFINRNVPGAITDMPSRAFVQGQRVPPGARGVAWRNLPQGEANGTPPLAPVKGSLHGAAPARPAPPEAAQSFGRPAIAARVPGRPASDELAQRFARAGGTVPGAGPAWRGAGNAPGGNPAASAPVRLSQAAPGYHGRNGAGQMPGTPGAPGGGNPGMPAFGPQRADGGARPPAPQGLIGTEHGGQPPVQGGDPRVRGWTTRPDQARGLPPQGGQPGSQLQQAQQFQQRQAEQRAAAQQNGRTLQTDPQGLGRQQQERQMGDQQRAQQAMQQQQEMQRQQQQRQIGDQQRGQQAVQQQQEMQRQQQERQMGDQQRAQQAMQQQQEMQRQQQQRQIGDQQRGQQAVQQQQERQRQQQERQMGDQQRAQQAMQQQQEMQRQQQERQMGEQQRAQQAMQQQQEMQRQQQQRQIGEQQRAQQAMQQQQEMQRQQQQRQVGEQQRAQQAMQQQEMQRQQQERQLADQQRAQQAMQQQQQRQVQEQQRQQQAMQQQAMQRQQQERQMQEQQRQQQEQQRQQQAIQQQQQQQQQQVMQRQQQDQQRQQQEMQRQQQEHQRQQQEQQRRQQELQRQQQHAAAQPQPVRQVAMQQPDAQGGAGNLPQYRA